MNEFIDVARFPPVLTSPSLFLLAEWAAWAPPFEPPLLCCALLCRGTGCVGPCGAWWMSANTGTCPTHGGPPAGDGRISLLSPVSRGQGKDTVRESNNFFYFYSRGLWTWVKYRVTDFFFLLQWLRNLVTILVSYVLPSINNKGFKPMCIGDTKVFISAQSWRKKALKINRVLMKGNTVIYDKRNYLNNIYGL